MSNLRPMLALVRTELRKSLRKVPREGMGKLPPMAWSMILWSALGLFIMLPATIGFLDETIADTGLLGLSWPYWLPLAGVVGISSIILTGETENFFPDRMELDVIAALPVPAGMTTSAKVVSVFVLSLIVGSAFVAPAYVVGLFTAPWPLFFALVFPVCVIVACAMSVGCFILLGALVVGLLPRRVARMALGIFQVGVGLVVMLLPQLSVGVADFGFAENIPMLWVAGAFGWIDGQPDLLALAGIALALAAVALTVAPYAVRNTYGKEAEISVTSTPTRTSCTTASLVRRFKNPHVQAGYDLTSWLLWRDAKLRMATISQIITPLVIVFIMGGKEDSNLLQFTPMVGALLGTALLTQSLRSEHADASWLYKITPIADARKLWLGVHRYHQFRVVPALVIVAGLAAGFLQSPLTGVCMAILSYGYTLIALDLSHFTVTAPPYSRRFRAGTSNMRVLTLFLVLIGMGLVSLPAFIIGHFITNELARLGIFFAIMLLTLLISTVLRRYVLKPMPIDPEAF